ncbi:SDR family NAD(P)-dependent oxidoreductase [Brevibacillus sp. B_LB10_24]|uniref:SDR family NAD(P)-dependent oxidoreductase n=1 Tax=Brevibacillus sp. B_LB10_24 TaxID=3380645 RepID=UPI0038B751E2
MEITEKMWDQVFDLNAKSVFLFSQAFIRKHMERGTYGNIVNMASQAGIVPTESMRPHYSSSKAAVVGLTKHMSKEFAPSGFRVNAVAPGYCISGERLQNVWKDRDVKTVLKNVPMGRTSTPEEQAAAVTFLCSDEASYITGVILDVTGGGF